MTNHLSKIRRRAGRAGGLAAAKRMTAKQRLARARKAGLASAAKRAASRRSRTGKGPMR